MSGPIESSGGGPTAPHEARSTGAAGRRGVVARALRAGLQFALALVVALALVELGLRLLGQGVPPRGPNNDLPLRRPIPEAQAPGLGDGLRPGSGGKVLYPGWGEEPDRWVEYRINPDGFRDRRLARAKAPGTFRIAVLGDSVTYGTGIDLLATLPKQLERLLAEHHPERTIEVLNAGVYAHNTTQQVAWLEYAVLDFEPDLVLVVATITDASGRNVAAPERDYGWEKTWIERLGLTSGVWDPGDADTPARRVTMELRRRSRLADLLANRSFGILFGRLKARSYLIDWDPAGPGVAAVRGALERAQAIARSQRDFRLAVAFYPVLTTLNEHHPLRDPMRVLAEVCADVGLPFVDLFPPLLGHSARALHAHAHDRHPNARANALVAAYLADQLEAADLIGP